MGEAATCAAASELSDLAKLLKEGKAHLGVEGADVPDDQDAGSDLGSGSEDPTATVGGMNRVQTKA